MHVGQAGQQRGIRQIDRGVPEAAVISLAAAICAILSPSITMA